MNSFLFAILSEQPTKKPRQARLSSTLDTERQPHAHRRSSDMYQRCGGGRRIIRKKLSGN